MSWFKVDDQFPTHPKVLRSGPDASWLYICGGCYCAKHLTDGLIPKVAVGTLSTLKGHARLAAVLVREGLWHDVGDDFEVHDYLIYNPSREKVESDRRAAVERRSKGGKRSADVRANAINPVPSRPDVPAEHDGVKPKLEPFHYDFETWWSAYPRKVHRADAFKAYQARRREGITHEQLDGARVHFKTASEGTEQRFIMHGSTFLAKDGPWSEYEHGIPEGEESNVAMINPFGAGIDLGPAKQPPKPFECSVGNEDCTDGWIDVPGEGRAFECECRRTKAVTG